MKRTVRSMILMLATALASTVVVTASSAEERDRPSDRMVNLDFEDIVVSIDPAHGTFSGVSG